MTKAQHQLQPTAEGLQELRTVDLTFLDYQQRKSKITLVNQRSDLKSFAQHLTTLGYAGVSGRELFENSQAWVHVSKSIVQSFVQSLLSEDYSVGSINRRLSTIKVYASMAAEAGFLDLSTLHRIKGVKSYSKSEAKRLNEKRPASNRGRKKTTTTLTEEQVERILGVTSDDLERLCLILFCDHGLRLAELHQLTWENFDLSSGFFTFYRPKVDLEQTHALTARAYQLAVDLAQEEGPIFKQSQRTISRWVAKAGAKLEIALSPHDLRHYWATQAAVSTPLHHLQNAGGWASPGMALRYIHNSEVANAGVIL